MRPGGSAGAGTVMLGVSGGLLRSVLIANDMFSHLLQTLSHCCLRESSFTCSWASL